MNKIENLSQLKLELERLQTRKVEQEDTLKRDVLEIKEALKPSNLISKAISSLFNTSQNNADFIRSGIMLGVTVLSEKLLQKKSSGVVKTLLSDVVRNIASAFISSESHPILEYIGHLFKLNKEMEQPTDTDISGEGKK